MKTEQNTTTIFTLPSGLELRMTNADMRDVEWLSGIERAVASERERCRNEALEAKLKAALEKIEISAQAGLCYFTLQSVREFLKDIRDVVADALARERPTR